MNDDVFIHSICSTRVTNKPDKGFYDLCVDVGESVLSSVSPLKIDSFYLASMDPALFGATGEIAASLTSELGMLPREVLGIRGTSSAGGIGVIPAYKDIASGLYDYTLLISCEQMNRVARDHQLSDEEKRKVRESIQKMLSGVIDPTERPYGLSMVLMGDLYEKALLRYLGISKERFREIIPDITMAMYDRAGQYPYAHFYGHNVTRDSYEKRKMVSPHYRRDDVVPPSTAACAILLSSKPPENPINNRLVRIKGIGQGVTHPALTRRFGPVTTSPSVRRAFYELARRASISLDALRNVDIAFPHDAFPSISRMILKEVGFSHDQSVEGLISGRFNPCGGLVKCGHPVGCSGELQLARAFQQMCHDGDAIPESIQQFPADRAFTVSVGAALTNIIATYLVASDVKGGSEPERDGSDGFDEAEFDRYLKLDGKYDRFETVMRSIPEDNGVVLTNTLSSLGWINLVQMHDTKKLVISDDEIDLGALVSCRERKDSLNEVAKIQAGQVDGEMLVSLGIEAPG